MYHFEGFPEGKDRYVVWRETGVGYTSADGEGRLRTDKVTVEIYTRKEFDPLIYEVMDAMDDQDEIAYEEPEIEWDANEKLIRYVIRCEVA